jgi:SRSO17 transposase
MVWRPGTRFTVPRKTSHKGPARRNLHAVQSEPVSIGELAKELTYRTVTWREGTRGKQSSLFAAVRVNTAHQHTQGGAPGPDEWLLCEWPSSEASPTKHYLISLPESTSVRELVRIAKLRWRVERDYQDLKNEVGLDHFEGRSWPGFHHHAAFMRSCPRVPRPPPGAFSPGARSAGRYRWSDVTSSRFCYVGW